MFSPKGKQSGEHYVRAKYPVELEAYRAKCGHLAIALSVMIDSGYPDSGRKGSAT